MRCDFSDRARYRARPNYRMLLLRFGHSPSFERLGGGLQGWYLLRNLFDWSWQRPARRAVERNDEAIDHWVKKRWPQLKNIHGVSRHHRAS